VEADRGYMKQRSYNVMSNNCILNKNKIEGTNTMGSTRSENLKGPNFRSLTIDRLF
jgi:hypothetical protein